MQRNWAQHLDLIAVATLTLVFAPLALVDASWAAPARVTLGFLFILVAPGYALAATLFPGRDDLDGVERVALTLGLSVMLVPLLGLLFNYTSWGIAPLPMLIGLLLLTLTLLAAALLRRSSLVPEQRHFSTSRLPNFADALKLLVASILVFAAIVGLVKTLRPPELSTEFFILGPGGKLEGYPDALTPGQPFELTFGITNQERRSQQFTIRTAEPAAEIAVTPEIARGETWQDTIRLTAPSGSGQVPLTFELYRQVDRQAYRTLRLFVNLDGERSTAVSGVNAGQSD